MIDGAASAALDFDIAQCGVLSSPEKQGLAFSAPDILHVELTICRSPSVCLERGGGW